MTEVTFCKAFLSALDARPIKLSSDHIADAKAYPAQPAFILPKLPSPPHPARPTRKTTLPASTDLSTPSSSSPSTSPTLTLKPLKSTFPTLPLPSLPATTTSIFDLKTAYSTHSSIPTAKIKILYKKKPVPDSKTVAEVVGPDGAGDVEFGVMVMGGAVATPPVLSPPVAVPSEEEKGLAGVGASTSASGSVGAAAQGPSGKEVVNEEFWTDLGSFVVQRIRDEEEGKRLVGLFKGAWEADR